MKTWRIPSALIRRVVFLALLPTLLILNNGCNVHHQHRTRLDVNTSTDSPDDRLCALERRPNYLLGFVEIDDQGWLWDTRPGTNQMQTVLDAIRAEEKNGRGLLIFTFVHGWKHNADYDDDYVKLFRRSLNRLARIEQHYSASNHVTPRKVVGVYVGWRGLTHETPGLKETTFWARKRTAHEVGRGAVTELFVRLEAIVAASKRRATEARARGDTNTVASRLMIVGHSFGGAVTYSALAPLMLERLITAEHDGGRNTASRGFGDMVVLVNPAFEAARFQVLLDAVRREPSSAREAVWPLNLAVFTSEADNATKSAFPFGRWLTTFFQSHQSREEHRANRTAIGHYGPFITHNLSLTNLSTHKPPRQTNAPAATAAPPPILDESRKDKHVAKRDGTENLEATQQTYQQNKPKMANLETRAEALRTNLFLGKTILKPTTNAAHSPFIIAKVSKRIIPDHNKIDRDTFMHVLSEFLLTLAPDERITNSLPHGGK